MKKITTLVLSLVLVLAMSITAFAATPNDDVKAALTEAGVTGEYYDQAVKFLANNELTAEQATAVKNEIKAAKATAGEAKSVADLSADQISKIKANIETAAAKVGAKVLLTRLFQLQMQRVHSTQYHLIQLRLQELLQQLLLLVLLY